MFANFILRRIFMNFPHRLWQLLTFNTEIYSLLIHQCTGQDLEKGKNTHQVFCNTEM